MAEIGFIGMGNMGTAMIRGLLSHGFSAQDLLFTDADKEKGKRMERELKVPFAGSNRECAGKVKYLVLAVKPQYYASVLEEIRPEIRKEQIVISIAPGKTVEMVAQKLGGQARVVRAMPNTPALLGEGMTGVCFDEQAFSQEEKEMICRFFTSFGKMERVEERLMDAVVCASGSSPAYVYMFIEALADSAVKCGLPRDKAYTMVAQTVLGSAKMVLETGKHPGELKDMVCSPGGTTIQGVRTLEKGGMRSAVMEAVIACVEKSGKL